MSKSDPNKPYEASRTRFSLRLRLTLLLVAVFAVIQLTVGGVRLVYLNSSVTALFEARLGERLLRRIGLTGPSVAGGGNGAYARNGADAGDGANGEGGVGGGDGRGRAGMGDWMAAGDDGVVRRPIAYGQPGDVPGAISLLLFDDAGRPLDRTTSGAFGTPSAGGINRPAGADAKGVPGTPSAVEPGADPLATATGVDEALQTPGVVIYRSITGQMALEARARAALNRSPALAGTGVRRPGGPNPGDRSNGMAESRTPDQSPGPSADLGAREGLTPLTGLTDRGDAAASDNNPSRVGRAGGDAVPLSASPASAGPASVGPTPERPTPGSSTPAASSAGTSVAASTPLSGHTAAVAFDDAGGRRRVAVAVITDPLLDQVLARTRRIVLLSTPLALLAAAVSAWFVAGVAVRPLFRLRQIAQRLRPDSLQDRVQFGSTASEVARLQDELNRALDRLNAGYQVQERFIANVSHEIKTPIATILTESQTLPGKADLPEAVRSFIQSTQEEMRRLGRLVESFLLLARVRDGKTTIATSRTVDVNDLLMEAYEACLPAAEQQGVILVPQLLEGPDDEATIQGDAALLRTLFENLLRNAIRFSPRGERVKFSAGLTGTTLRTRVRDFGPGIPADLVGQVFERFAQSKAERRLGRGSGIGLEIAKGIAELHGGDLTVENCIDVGCVFTATLHVDAPDPPGLTPPA